MPFAEVASDVVSHSQEIVVKQSVIPDEENWFHHLFHYFKNHSFLREDVKLQATVEPGVITKMWQHASKTKLFYHPADLPSSCSCFMGRNVSVNIDATNVVQTGAIKHVEAHASFKQVFNKTD